MTAFFSSLLSATGLLRSFYVFIAAGGCA